MVLICMSTIYWSTSHILVMNEFLFVGFCSSRLLVVGAHSIRLGFRPIYIKRIELALGFVRPALFCIEVIRRWYWGFYWMKVKCISEPNAKPPILFRKRTLSIVLKIYKWQPVQLASIFFIAQSKGLLIRIFFHRWIINKISLNWVDI